MASLQERKRKNGKSAHIVQFMLDNRRRSVFLDAKYSKRVAKEVSFYVDELAKSVDNKAMISGNIFEIMKKVEGLNSEVKQYGQFIIPKLIVHDLRVVGQN